MVERVTRCVALGVLGLVWTLLLIPAKPTHADGPPTLFLPTPRGETWEVIQGYNCGTHDSWGRLSFDIVNADGRTRGAPVYAAADGTIFYWGGNSGTLILSHGEGYYTMYTHMQAWIGKPIGTWVAQGTEIGKVGAVNPTPTIPHLHFTFFRADGPYASNRRPLALQFADDPAYNFPDTGKCNAHGGTLLTATGSQADIAAPEITWAGTPAQTWVNSGRVDWSLSDASTIKGFSQAWDVEPSAESEPQFPATTTGYLELDQPGKHTIMVRAWDSLGNTTVSGYEVWFDPTAPILPPSTATQEANQPDASVAFTLAWDSASDDLSGVKGYQLYFGADPAGTSEWFTTESQIGLGPQVTGTYYLRVRAQDNAGNFSEWVTVQTITVP